MSFFDFIFPKRCVGCKSFGDFICSNCFATIELSSTFFCAMCNGPSVNGLTHSTCRRKYGLDGVFPVAVYKWIVKKLLYQFKYSPNLSSLSGMLSSIMYESLLQNEAFYSCLRGDIALVPVPLNSKRLRRQGYSPSGLLSKGLGTRFGFNVFPALERVKDASHHKLKKEEKKENIKGSFIMSHNIKFEIKNKTVILVDDIAKTHSTLIECASVLKQSGAGKVYAIVFAKEA